MRVQRRGALGAAHGADDAIEFFPAEFFDEMLRRIAEAETDQHCSCHSHAAAHSAMTSGSDSRCAAAQSFEPGAIETAERPHRGAANQRRSIAEQSLGFAGETGVLGIADRDQHVAQKTVAADALDRAFRKQRAEAGIVEPRQFGKSRRAQHFARFELHLAAGLGEFVPRTDREAIVAAVDAVAHQRAQFARDGALVLDGEIRDAAPRIEPIRRRETRRSGRRRGRRGRCRNDRAPARRRQIERGEDGAEEQPGAELERNQIGVLALPAQPRRLGKRLLHHGRGIDEHLDVAAGLVDQPAAEILQPRLDHLVIIVALGIDRDGAARALLQDRQRIAARAVIDAEHDDRAHVAATSRADRRGGRPWPPSSPCRRERLRRGRFATARRPKGSHPAAPRR